MKALSLIVSASGLLATPSKLSPGPVSGTPPAVPYRDLVQGQVSARGHDAHRIVAADRMPVAVDGEIVSDIQGSAERRRFVRGQNDDIVAVARLAICVVRI